MFDLKDEVYVVDKDKMNINGAIIIRKEYEEYDDSVRVCSSYDVNTAHTIDGNKAVYKCTVSDAHGSYDIVKTIHSNELDAQKELLELWKDKRGPVCRIDMNIENDVKLDFGDVLIKPKRSTLESRSQVNLVRKFKPKYGTPFEGTGVIAANMATGTFSILHEFMKNNMFVAIAKHNNHKWIEEYDKDNDTIQYGFYTIGMNDNELEGFKEFYQHVVRNQNMSVYTSSMKRHHFEHDIKICVDIANGYTQKFADFITKVRKIFPRNVIIAGNVSTPEMTQELIIAGADYVKVGVGPGSVCSTRRVTGVGYPQLSAIIECSEAAHALEGGIVADGGIRTPGDVAKALGANADMVMIGGMFAGTDECDGDIQEKYYHDGEMVWDNGKFVPNIVTKKYQVFYGMSSDLAQEKHFGGKKDYRASEGVVSEVPYKGSVSKVIKDLLLKTSENVLHLLE